MNNVKNSIGWADYTWNPVTGCKRGCIYCYAKRIHDRFYNYPFSNIILHPHRIRDPEKIKKSSKIFVGSMSDIEYWSDEQFNVVVDNCEVFNWHTFMFLSKSSYSYRVLMPKNTMQGLTVEIPSNKIMMAQIKQISLQQRPFLSIEPIAGCLYNDIQDNIELVIVGAESGNRKEKIIPQKEWIQSIKDHVPSNKIYWKKNIAKLFPELIP